MVSRRSYSVTLEIASSHSDSEINSGVRFWLKPEDGNVNMCLTLRIERSRPEIRIECWERQNHRAHRSQLIWITKQGDRVNVTHHPLTIPFDSPFCRQSSRPEKREMLRFQNNNWRNSQRRFGTSRAGSSDWSPFVRFGGIIDSRSYHTKGG